MSTSLAWRRHSVTHCHYLWALKCIARVKVNASKSHTISICALHCIDGCGWVVGCMQQCVLQSRRESVGQTWQSETHSHQHSCNSTFTYFCWHVAYAMPACANQTHTAQPRVHLQSRTDLAINIIFPASENVCVNQSDQYISMHYFERLWHFRKRKLRSIGNESKGITELAPYANTKMSNFRLLSWREARAQRFGATCVRIFFTHSSHPRYCQWICVSLLFRRTARFSYMLVGAGKKRDIVYYSEHDHVPTDRRFAYVQTRL